MSTRSQTRLWSRHAASKYSTVTSNLNYRFFAGNHIKSVIIQTSLSSHLLSVDTLFCSSVHSMICSMLSVCFCLLELTRLKACKWSFIFFQIPVLYGSSLPLGTVSCGVCCLPLFPPVPCVIFIFLFFFVFVFSRGVIDLVTTTQFVLVRLEEVKPFLIFLM